MQTQQNDDLEFSRVLFLLKRRAWIIVSVGLLAALLAFVYTSLQPKLYRATAEVNAVDQTAGLFQNSGDPDPTRRTSNAVFLVGSRAVQDPAKASLGSSASSVKSIAGSSVPFTDVVSIDVVADSAEVARDAADAVAGVFVEQQDALIVRGRQVQATDLRRIADDLDKEVAVMDQSLARAEGTELESLRVQRTRLIGQQADLRTRANQLDTEAELKTGAIAVLTAAETPSSPFAPLPARNAILAGLVGVFLATAAVIIFDWLNNRVRMPEEISRLTGGLPIIGSVPLVGSKRLHRRRLPERQRAFVEGHSAAEEAYRALATNIRFAMIGRATTRIVVTSGSPGEGKTTLVANLARTLAIAGSKVVVVSADLRKPDLGECFGIDESESGLTSVLLGDALLPAAVRQVECMPGVNLLFLPAGPIPSNPQAVLASGAMGEVLARLESAGAEVILLDTAPVLPVADTLALMQHCHSVVLSVVPEATKRSDLKETVGRLRHIEAQILGISLDGVTKQMLGYYGLGAGVYGSREKSRGADPAEDSRAATGPLR